MSAAELAPAVIVRVAGWPLETLDRFGDANLASTAQAADPADPRAWRAFAERHAEVLAHEQAALFGLATEDSAFFRALALANPAFAVRLQALQREPAEGRRLRRTKRVRHAETTLYRYLSRAVARTVPSDLWSGVALGRWGQTTLVGRVPSARRLYPDLRVYQDLLRRMAGRPDLRGRAPWRLNPTLRPVPGGNWRFWSRRADGAVVRREVDGDAFTSEAIALLARTGTTESRALTAALAPLASAHDHDAMELVEALISEGLLIGGPDLPLRFGNAWEALDRVTPLLEDPARSWWHAAVEQLRGICHRVEGQLETISGDALIEAVNEAAEIPRALAGQLGISLGEAPRSVLRCDWRAPFEVTLGPELRQRIEVALDHYQCTRQAYGPAVAVRAAYRRQLARMVGAGVDVAGIDADFASTRPARPPRTWRELVVLAGLEETVAEQIARWERLLAGPEREVTCPLHTPPDGAPLGVFIVTPGRGPCLTVQGISDEVAPVYARFSGLWNPGGETPGDPLYRWLKDSLREVGARHGISVYELLQPCEANPNALARPDFGVKPLAIWGTEMGPESVTNVRFVIDSRSGCPLAKVGPDGETAAVFALTSADIGHGDPLAELLLRSSFRVGPTAQFYASSLLFEQELQAESPTPRVRAPDGLVVQVRRTILSGQTLRALIEAGPALRFARWQRLARDLHWPRLVMVRRDHHSSLVLPVASPLAVEAIFEGAAGANTLTVEDFDQEPWLTDEEGQHFLAELAVPFRREANEWSSRQVPR